MDIILTPAATPFYRKHWYLGVGVLAAALFLVLTWKYRGVSSLARTDDLLIDTVTRGPLLVSVRGYGQLSSKNVYQVGAASEGRVEKIFVSAGTLVNEGDVLVQLANTELLQQFHDAQLEYDAQDADFTASEITGEAQLLDLRTDIANAEIDYQIARMDLDAKNELLAKGAGIISRVELESTKLTVEQYRRRWEMEQARVVKTEESMLAQRKAKESRLLITRNTLDKARQLVEGLAIKASVAGIVNDMALEPGQPVRQGEHITRIAEPRALVAKIQIPELQVQGIVPGMNATVDTRSDLIEGRVARIDPRVIDGAVLVEIDLLGSLPEGIRPDLNVEATIEIDHIADTVFVKRPVFARAFSQDTIFRIAADGDIAERIPLRYGQASANFIEVLDGVNVGDRLIISDPTMFADSDRVLIR
jgi:multidrug resistance efflux pump